jgi:hypothetical protein
MGMALDSELMRDLGEAKAALARHGIVIIRAIETELEPAIMAGAKSSMASSPGRLGKMDDDELDEFSEKLRKTALRSADELMELYVRLLAKLGTESLPDLSKELEGIGQLFKWERVKTSIASVNTMLAEQGFKAVVLEGPGDLSEGFELELEQIWPSAFERFKALVDEAARKLEETEQAPQKPQSQKRAKKAQTKE